MSKHHNIPDPNHTEANSTKSLHEKLNIKPPMTDAELLAQPAYVDLQAKLQEAVQKADENWDRMLRMQAEMENLRRRVERDVENAHKYALEKFVNELLPVVDSLERSLISPDNTDNQNLLDGIQLTLKMFYAALEKFGVKPIDPEAQSFNPEWHQAVSTLVDDSQPAGTVVNVLQKGYLLNNRLVRPALVVVTKAS